MPIWEKELSDNDFPYRALKLTEKKLRKEIDRKTARTKKRDMLGYLDHFGDFKKYNEYFVGWVSVDCLTQSITGGPYNINQNKEQNEEEFLKYNDDDLDMDMLDASCYASLAYSEDIKPEQLAVTTC